MRSIVDQHRARQLSSDERLLAGGELRCGRPNSGEATVVGGDDLFWIFSSGESTAPALVHNKKEPTFK